MDIYSFLSSRDVAEHCRKIEKVWSPVEMALIIGHSKKPLEERHAAWRKLLTDYPDMSVSPPEGVSQEAEVYFQSLHKMILEQISYEERMAHTFMEDKEKSIGKREPMRDVHEFFSSMFCEDIPNPFEVGDVLTILDQGTGKEDYVFVLSPPDEGEKEFYGKYAYMGYYVNQEGVIDQEAFYRADCMEYYRKPYRGKIRLLHYVSLYLKGKLELFELLAMQCRIPLEHICKEIILGDYGEWGEEQYKEESEPKLMPWLEGKFTFSQIEWFSKECNVSMEKLQEDMSNNAGASKYYMHFCHIVQEEDGFEQAGNSRFNPARRAMAKSFLDEYELSNAE